MTLVKTVHVVISKDIISPGFRSWFWALIFDFKSTKTCLFLEFTPDRRLSINLNSDLDQSSSKTQYKLAPVIVAHQAGAVIPVSVP